jgi:hypothetical protein
MTPTSPEKFNLIRDEKGRLVLHRPDQADVEDVRIRRIFPLTHDDRYISIRTSEGKELLLIEDLKSLDPTTVAIVKEMLTATSFVPQIQHVDDVDVRFGYQQWKVQTDRGPADFRVQEREDIRFLPDGRFRIKDADGNGYEMPSLKSLDDQSRKAVEPLV